MKAASFDYVRPDDLDHALRLLAEHRAGAKLLAGGQSLGPMLNLRLARPQLLIDVARLDALARIEDLGTAWRIGAGVTHARIEDARGKLAGCEMLSDVAFGIAYRSVRNRGTIGGSLAHADPAADWPVALAAFGASVNLRRAGGTRSLPLERFVLGVFTTALDDDEIIESIDVPKLSGAGRYGYYKFCRKTGEFAEASAAAVFDPQSGVARIYLGALRNAPLPLAALAQRIAAEGRPAASKEAVDARARRSSPRPRSDRAAHGDRQRSCARSIRCCGHDARHPHGQRPAGRRDGRAAHASCRLPARAVPPHRHASRLRAWRLRRLHCPDQRRARALLHRLRRRLRRAGGAHHRGFRGRSADAAAARSLHARARAAMRLLHARHVDRRLATSCSGCRAPTRSASGSSFPATSAAAPAISASSGRCAAWRQARRQEAG